MTNQSTDERIDLLEKRVTELMALVRFHDAMRVKLEKSIGAIDQQLIKTDTGLHRIRGRMAIAFKKKGKPAKPKAQAKASPAARAKIMAKKRKPTKPGSRSLK